MYTHCTPNDNTYMYTCCIASDTIMYMYMYTHHCTPNDNTYMYMYTCCKASDNTYMLYMYTHCKSSDNTHYRSTVHIGHPTPVIIYVHVYTCTCTDIVKPVIMHTFVHVHLHTVVHVNTLYRQCCTHCTVSAVHNSSTLRPRDICF